MELSTDLLRILDASANRAREGLRVIEDFARFRLNDAFLTQSLKECRHSLATIMSELPPNGLLAARDTLHDVGVAIETTAEYQRSSICDVVIAAFKRVQEALRSLEEFTKVIDPRLSKRLEQNRYQMYTLEKAVLRTASARDRLQQHHLYLLVTADQCRIGFEAVVQAALAGGVRLFQLREKHCSDREFLQLARQIRNWTRASDALLIINDRPDLAVLADADGVHVGQTELTVADARVIVGPEKLVGVSTHSIEQARQAVLDGADYLGVGPTFPSTTKSFAEFPGLTFVSQVAAEISLPWYAIGGIDTHNVAQVVTAGATRVAVSGVICSSPAPVPITQQLLATLN